MYQMTLPDFNVFLSVYTKTQMSACYGFLAVCILPVYCVSIQAEV